MEGVFRYIDENLDAATKDLFELCRLPTVSAQNKAIPETAAFVTALLQREGFAAQILPKPPGGQPVVYGEQRGRSNRTLLFYNHYDVQPPDPLDEWTVDPFNPERRGDKLIGRGISDNKGNIISRLLALRALKAAGDGLPCNVKFCIEGDEEIGSPQIEPFIHEHKDLLAADACIWEGSKATWDGTPTIQLGVKGLLYVDLEVKGANRDLHSSYGTVIPNPAWRLTWALASLKDGDERVLIDGFYADVRESTEAELTALMAFPDDGAETLASLGLSKALLGVSGLDYRLRHYLQPTCTIDGLTSGYQGLGAKTVLPARASAKIDFRLVVDQDPRDILAKLRRHLDQRGFSDVEIAAHNAEKPARTSRADPFVRTVIESARPVYGREPYVLPNMPATGPMHHFVHDLGLPTVLVGVNYVGDRDHAPDENIRIEDFRQATEHVAALLARFAAP